MFICYGQLLSSYFFHMFCKFSYTQMTDMSTQAKLAQKMIDPKTATPKGGHSYGPYFLEYCLMAE